MVYDFLYHDARRISSILSQLSEHGHVQQIKHTKSSEESTDTAMSIEGSAEIPLILKAKSDAKSSFVDKSKRASEETYDPFWKNAIKFIRYLEESGISNEHISTANIGEFVHCSGHMIIIDLSLLQKAFKLESVRSFMLHEAIKSVPKEHKNKKDLDFIRDNLFSSVELTTLLPDIVQCTILPGNPDPLPIWCTLDKSNMVVSPSDLLLKHGYGIDGIWKVYGIFDAHIRLNTQSDEEIAHFGKMISGQLGAGVLAMVPKIREMLGRPSLSRGITPLVIFREIEKVVSQ